MNFWSNIAFVFYMLQVAHAGTTHTSKACYGAAGLPCTEHELSCNNTQTIHIQDAYYTNNTECTVIGQSQCNIVNQDNVTEGARLSSFNTTEMTSLKHNCSASCTYRAPRNKDVAFSVVRYECSEEPTSIGTSTPTTPTALTTPTTPAEPTRMGTSTLSTPTALTTSTTPAESTNIGTSTRAMELQGSDQTPAAVGGIVTTILVLIVITLILVWYLRKRRRKTDQSEKEKTQSKDRKTDIKYSLSGNIPQSHYHEIDDLKTKTRSSDYDYATVDGAATALNKNTYLTIEPATKPTTNQISATSTTEDDYDHIGDKLPALTSDYDTTASVAQSAGTGAYSREDDYGYNLLHEGKSNKTVQNDYDTAASANKAVAQLGRIDEKTAEDDYDHFPGTNDNSQTLRSSHAGKVRDRSDDYAFAGSMQ